MWLSFCHFLYYRLNEWTCLTLSYGMYINLIRLLFVHCVLETYSLLCICSCFIPKWRAVYYKLLSVCLHVGHVGRLIFRFSWNNECTVYDETCFSMFYVVGCWKENGGRSKTCFSALMDICMRLPQEKG